MYTGVCIGNNNTLFLVNKLSLHTTNIIYTGRLPLLKVYALTRCTNAALAEVRAKESRFHRPTVVPLSDITVDGRWLLSANV